MRKKKSITLRSKPTYQGYSHGFKIAIIKRIENGQLSVNQAAKEYDVHRTSIAKWIKKYGNLDRKLRNMQGKSPKQKIDELEKKLKEAENNLNLGNCNGNHRRRISCRRKKNYLTRYQRHVLRNMDKKSK